MSGLNTASYILTLRSGLSANGGKEAATNLILGTINNQDYVREHGYEEDLSSKKISRVLGELANTPDGIQQASVIPEVIDETIKNFNKDVIPDLNPHLKDDTLANIRKLIKCDVTISEPKKEFLLNYYKHGQTTEFLAYTFLYAVNKPNIMREGEEVEVDDIQFLAEVGYECPLCHKELVEQVRGKVRKKYRITQIFPNDLDDDIAAAFEAEYPKPVNLNAPDNLIALSEEESNDYLFAPSVELYKKLFETKRALVKSHQAKMNVNQEQLEEDIRTVLDAVMDLQDLPATEPLNFDALHVDEKIREPFVLRKTVRDEAITYYSYIEKVFRDSNANFDVIASQIKASSKMLESSGLSQKEVISQLSEWIRHQAGLGDDAELASNIVVSFFVQNCEVFHS